MLGFYDFFFLKENNDIRLAGHFQQKKYRNKSSMYLPVYIVGTH